MEAPPGGVASSWSALAEVRATETAELVAQLPVETPFASPLEETALDECLACVQHGHRY